MVRAPSTGTDPERYTVPAAERAVLARSSATAGSRRAPDAGRQRRPPLGRRPPRRPGVVGVPRWQEVTTPASRWPPASAPTRSTPSRRRRSTTGGRRSCPGSSTPGRRRSRHADRAARAGVPRGRILDVTPPAHDLDDLPQPIPVRFENTSACRWPALGVRPEGLSCSLPSGSARRAAATAAGRSRGSHTTSPRHDRRRQSFGLPAAASVAAGRSRWRSCSRASKEPLATHAVEIEVRGFGGRRAVIDHRAVCRGMVPPPASLTSVGRWRFEEQASRRGTLGRA